MCKQATCLCTPSADHSSPLCLLLTFLFSAFFCLVCLCVSSRSQGLCVTVKYTQIIFCFVWYDCYVLCNSSSHQQWFQGIFSGFSFTIGIFLPLKIIKAASYLHFSSTFCLLTFFYWFDWFHIKCPKLRRIWRGCGLNFQGYEHSFISFSLLFP